MRNDTRTLMVGIFLVVAALLLAGAYAAWGDCFPPPHNRFAGVGLPDPTAELARARRERPGDLQYHADTLQRAYWTRWGCGVGQPGVRPDGRYCPVPLCSGLEPCRNGGAEFFGLDLRTLERACAAGAFGQGLDCACSTTEVLDYEYSDPATVYHPISRTHRPRFAPGLEPGVPPAPAPEPPLVEIRGPFEVSDGQVFAVEAKATRCPADSWRWQVSTGRVLSAAGNRASIVCVLAPGLTAGPCVVDAIPLPGCGSVAGSIVVSVVRPAPLPVPPEPPRAVAPPPVPPEKLRNWGQVVEFFRLFHEWYLRAFPAPGIPSTSRSNLRLESQPGVDLR